MFRTGNPALNMNTFQNAANESWYHGPAEGETYGQPSRVDASQVMTIAGAVAKTAILGTIMVAVAGVAWVMSFRNPSLAPLFLWPGIIGGLIVALVISFRPTTAPWASPIYAVFEGLVLGAISQFFEQMYPGIVGQAVGGTLGVFALMLVLYSNRVLRATPSFVKGLAVATGAVLLVYLVSFVAGFFGLRTGLLYGAGTLSIGFSLVIIGLAALHLIVDFDIIEQGAAIQAPKYMEWYAAFGLLVTLVWLYISILRLLSKLRRR